LRATLAELGKHQDVETATLRLVADKYGV